MGKDITTVSRLTIGPDLGDQHTAGYVLTGSGEVEETFRVATTMSALGRTMAGFESSRVVLEVGTHSPWVSRLGSLIVLHFNSVKTPIVTILFQLESFLLHRTSPLICVYKFRAAILFAQPIDEVPPAIGGLHHSSAFKFYSLVKPTTD